jgi:hypothetical protein
MNLSFQCQFPHGEEGNFKMHKLISNDTGELYFLKFDATKSGSCLPSLRWALLPPSSGSDDGGHIFLSSTHKHLHSDMSQNSYLLKNVESYNNCIINCISYRMFFILNFHNVLSL